VDKPDFYPPPDHQQPITCFAVQARPKYRHALGSFVKISPRSHAQTWGRQYHRWCVRPDSSCCLLSRSTPIRGNSQGADRSATRGPGHHLAGCLLRENRAAGQTGLAKTRPGRTRHNQPFDLNEPDASIASTLVEFNPRYALVPKIYSRHGILHRADAPSSIRTRSRLVRHFNSETMWARSHPHGLIDPLSGVLTAEQQPPGCLWHQLDRAPRVAAFGNGPRPAPRTSPQGRSGDSGYACTTCRVPGGPTDASAHPGPPRL